MVALLKIMHYHFRLGVHRVFCMCEFFNINFIFLYNCVLHEA